MIYRGTAQQMTEVADAQSVTFVPSAERRIFQVYGTGSVQYGSGPALDIPGNGFTPVTPHTGSITVNGPAVVVHGVSDAGQ